jgi:hypothetical protein
MPSLPIMAQAYNRTWEDAALQPGGFMNMVSRVK